ncbi:tRNA lysidine(34) synthetase TilS [Rhodonellum sp.]|uniref:tRNA lysidine(34) synthetase TilS n=1 Tax=Rhodonellum sp. TaxID=2231180 RepID=UPI002727BC22|nr:tRNA lysidine(34) synthetase TilS [Rhodonellum sp.]MDO9551723.1 tRNA lysidine(34) synthetase TilS [Rhodonellum sp.]
MVDDFIRHIRSKNLLDAHKPYLLAISGGMDSVCLGNLLKAAGIDFSLAHVNFQLRGQESQGDEAFVRELAEEWGVPVFVNKTKEDDFKERNQSVQMGARDFRYQWFEELIKEHHFEGVLVAHHFEDQIETKLLNLLRGTGIEGLYGMADRRGNIIRPLLPFRRVEIQKYLEENGKVWRNDSSNLKNEYKRNFLRNQVIPLLAEGFPDGLSAIDLSFQRLKDTGRAFFYFFGEWKKNAVRQEGDHFYLPLDAIEFLPGKNSMLYYWLREYGFNYSDVVSIMEGIQKKEPGKTYFSQTHVINLDREMLIVGSDDFELEPIDIQATDIQIRIKNHHYELIHLSGEHELDRARENAMLDMDRLEFPLTVRKWTLGDKFVPLGMKNEKKISDLLIDLKIPLIHKKTVTVLCSGDQIAWVMGYRISDRFKCDANTKRTLYFKKT